MVAMPAKAARTYMPIEEKTWIQSSSSEPYWCRALLRRDHPQRRAELRSPDRLGQNNAIREAVRKCISAIARQEKEGDTPLSQGVRDRCTGLLPEVEIQDCQIDCMICDQAQCRSRRHTRAHNPMTQVFQQVSQIVREENFVFHNQYVQQVTSIHLLPPKQVSGSKIFT